MNNETPEYAQPNTVTSDYSINSAYVSVLGFEKLH
jgi:hypothetical protein